MGMADRQGLLGPGDGHIAQPPLLLHFLLVSNGSHTGEQSVLKSNQKHMGELQAFGGMDRHHHHGIISGAVLLQVCIQGDLLQETCQGGHIGVRHIGVDTGF